MDISGEAVDGVSVVTARGRLDGAASGTFADRVQELIVADRPKLLVDFAGIDFVTSAGLRVVLTLLKRVKSLNGVFALCGVQAPVREVLDITGFAGMIDIYPAREPALAALR
jgi:anti-anti-sigma factor